jgi:hypothetical protein
MRLNESWLSVWLMVEHDPPPASGVRAPISPVRRETLDAIGP